MADYSHDWLCREIIDNCQDAIIFADRSGLIRLWNFGAEEIFQYSAEEALGQSLDIIIPEKLRDRHWEGYRKVIGTGSTIYGKQLLAVPAIRKDGERISVEFTIVLIHTSTGELLGSAAIIRDVTARWLREKGLKERLAQLEKS